MMMIITFGIVEIALGVILKIVQQKKGKMVYVVTGDCQHVYIVRYLLCLLGMRQRFIGLVIET
jgi:hypothetical protein